jgi:hypothetical protein
LGRYRNLAADDWRNIPITLTDPKKGERTAQSCNIGCLRQLWAGGGACNFSPTRRNYELLSTSTYSRCAAKLLNFSSSPDEVKSAWRLGGVISEFSAGPKCKPYYLYPISLMVANGYISRR